MSEQAITRRVAPRSAGFLEDLRSVSLRAIRLTWRDPEAFLPALVIPVFFFVVNVGALQKFVEGSFPAGFDYKAFQLPVAVVFAVTGVSRANSLVLDIQNGYFDRLLLTPVSRGTLLLGLMSADVVLIIALATPVALLGLAIGIHSATGLLGVIAFVLMAGLWGLAFTGFPYSIALENRQPDCGQQRVPPVLPIRVLDDGVPAAGEHDWMARDGNEVQPHDVSAGRDASRVAGRLGVGADRAGPAGDCGSRRRVVQSRLRRAARAASNGTSADGGRHRAEHRDEVVGSDLDVESAATTADEDRIEQHAGLVDDHRQRPLLTERADSANDIAGDALARSRAGTSRHACRELRPQAP